MMFRKLLSPALACFALQSTIPATALAAEGWDVTLTPYLWAFGLDGDIQAHGEDVNISSDFGDIIDNLDFGGSALLEFNNGNWVNYAQLDYLKLDTGDVTTRRPGIDAELEFENTLLTLATGYRVLMGERSTLDVLVGLRYMGADATISLENIGERQGDNSVYDGILALRPRLALARDWYFSPTMSVGAGDSDLTWELSPMFVYDCCGTEIRFGYRSLNYEFEKGSDSVDLSVSGPVIGVGFKF